MRQKKYLKPQIATRVDASESKQMRQIEHF